MQLAGTPERLDFKALVENADPHGTSTKRAAWPTRAVRFGNGHESQ